MLPRNKLEHYYIDTEPVQIKSLAYKVYNNFFLFMDYDFLSSINTYSFDMQDKIRYDITTNEKFMLQLVI